MRKNILLSTTRQWNPGDEFILFGVLNLLKDYVGDFNPIIFNRNPDIRPCDLKYNHLLTRGFNSNIESKCFRGQGVILSHFRDRFCDNSFRDGMSGECIDYVIFAGTPEWEGTRLKSLYRYITRYNKKTCFLGIGYGGSQVSNNELYSRVWEKAELITTRDKKTEEMMSTYNAKYICCPSILSSKEEKKISNVSRVAVVFSTSQTHIGNRVSYETDLYLQKLYAQLLNTYDCSFICHYIDEVEILRKRYPDVEVLYSFNSQDYFNIYSRFDMVIGARVHAIGICASMGIPGIMIAHDARSSTVEGFQAQVIIPEKDEIERAMHIISETIERASYLNMSLCKHKKQVYEQYMVLLERETTLRDE